MSSCSAASVWRWALESGRPIAHVAADLGTRPNEVSAVIDHDRDRFGVEPICRVLDVSASAYYQRASGQRSARDVEDERLLGVIRALHATNYYAYGYRRMHKALRRAGDENDGLRWPRRDGGRRAVAGRRRAGAARRCRGSR